MRGDELIRKKSGKKKLLGDHIPTTKKIIHGVNNFHLTRRVILKCFFSSHLTGKHRSKLRK
jgi:hypothetical protein